MTNISDAIFRFYMAYRYAFRAHKPLLLARQGKAAMDVYIRDKARLRYVDFSIDYSCNMNCAHCFNKTMAPGADSRRVLSLGDYRSIARECRELGAIAFSFQGGEPMLNMERLESVIHAVGPEQSLISITTNGSLCTEENVKRLARVGVDIFTISLDSGIEEEHDQFRGKTGAYKSAMGAVERVLRHGMNVTIGTTVSHQNVRSEGLLKIMEFASQKRCLLSLALAVPAGNWVANDDIILNEEDRKLVDDYCKSSPFVRTDLGGNYKHFGCGAMKEIMYITPYGEVLACPFLHISFGQVPNEPISAIRERALQLPHLSRYWPTCLAATDDEFRKNVLVQLRGRTNGIATAEEISWPQCCNPPTVNRTWI